MVTKNDAWMLSLTRNFANCKIKHEYYSNDAKKDESQKTKTPLFLASKMCFYGQPVLQVGSKVDYLLEGKS